MSEKSWSQQIEAHAAAVRRRVLRHTIDNNGGYLSQACSAAEALVALYQRVMQVGPSEGPLVPPPFVSVPGPGAPPLTGAAYNGPQGPEFDRFIFSPVHYALVLYSVLIELGRLGPKALDDFNVDGSRMELIGAEHSPGHEVTAGSLAQGISQALGIAMARQLRGDTGRVWVYMSDGEFQEGQTWEAFAAAAYHGVGALRVIVDVNGQQCDGAMEDVMEVASIAAKLASFGISAVEVDGHDVEALCEAALMETGAEVPHVVLAITDACHGLPILRERTPKLHYVRFKSEDERARYRAVLAELEQGGES